MYKLILILCFALLIAPLSQAQSEVNDNLVTHLACENLTKETLLQSLRPDFDSVQNQIPVPNWSFSAGFYEIAGCWSLSRNQRLLFYLSGFPESVNSVADTLDMIRRWTPAWSQFDFLTFQDTHRLTLLPPIPQFFKSIEQGYTQNVGPTQVLRNFKADVETYQLHRFHQFLKNKDYIDGPRERDPKFNRVSFTSLLTNLNSRRLTLMLLRPSLTAQHVVLAKSYQQISSTSYEFKVYDSNHPNIENSVFYDTSTEHFYAPSIVKEFKIKHPEAPIGLFIVDEDEREQALDYLVKYYQTQCGGTQSLWVRK